MQIPLMVRCLIRTIYIISAILTGDLLKAQDIVPVGETIHTSKIKLSVPIEGESRIYIDSANGMGSNQLTGLPINQTIDRSFASKIPARDINRNFYLRFRITNDTDTSTRLFFLPGFYFREIVLYKMTDSGGVSDSIPAISGPGNENNFNPIVGEIKLDSGESATFIARLKFIKTTVNNLRPMLSQDFYLPSLIASIQNERRISAIITYLICGIMLMMMIYSLAQFFANRTMEFIYYAAYGTLLGIMFFLKAALYKYPTEENFFFESYADFMLQATATIFYFLFLIKFVNAREDFPALNIVLKALQYITIAGMALFTYLNFFTDNFPLQNLIENLIKYSWSFCTVFVISYSIINRQSILRYLAIGHSFLFVGGLLSLFLINSSQRFTDARSALINDSLFWYELGILFELVFFLVALSVKNKQDISARAREKERLLMEYEKTAIENKMAVLAAKQEERNRISADMHDELGSGVTAIRLLSELAKTKMKDPILPEIDKISNSASELISKMNTIIWTMKSSNDTVDNMIAYVRSYAYEFLDNADIICKLDYPDNIPAIEMSGEKRRNIFLCIKESLNNIVKHANATVVTISFRLGPHLVIQIHDNGVGVNPEKIREFSSGMTNMRKRMENIDGHFGIRSNDGTTITLSVPLQ